MLPQSWEGSTAVNLSAPANSIVYIIIWAVVIAGVFFVYQRGRTMGRWTTRDILIIAIMSVLLEVYDNLIGDQFVTPIIQLIPFGHILALNDLPYMFLLIVGIALIRKPGCATAMVFLNYILMQVFYSGTGIDVSMWPYGLLQGLFVDFYIIARSGHVFEEGGRSAFVDGLIIGALRAVPAVTVQSAFLGPLFQGEIKTLGYVFFYSLFNLIGNGLEAAISGLLAVRIVRFGQQNNGDETGERDTGYNVQPYSWDSANSMEASELNHIGAIGLFFTFLVGLDGMFMQIINYRPDDQGGNTLHMADGTTVLIASGLLLIISLVAFLLSARAARKKTIVDTPAATSTRTVPLVDTPAAIPTRTVPLADTPAATPASIVPLVDTPAATPTSIVPTVDIPVVTEEVSTHIKARVKRIKIHS